MSPFELVIKYADGSVYWKENFNSRLELDAWVNREKTRPYWKHNFTTEIVDNTAAIEAAKKAAKDASDAVEAARKLKKDAIKAAKDKPNKTQKDVEDLVNLLADLVLSN